MKNSIDDEEEIEIYDIPPPNHSDYVMLVAPLACWGLATYMGWGDGPVVALFNGAYYAIGSLVVIVLMQFALRDPPSIFFRDAAGRIFDTPFGLWSDRDPARCAAEDAAYKYLEKKIKGEENLKK